MYRTQFLEPELHFDQVGLVHKPNYYYQVDCIVFNDIYGSMNGCKAPLLLFIITIGYGRKLCLKIIRFENKMVRK